MMCVRVCLKFILHAPDVMHCPSVSGFRMIMIARRNTLQYSRAKATSFLRDGLIQNCDLYGYISVSNEYNNTIFERATFTKLQGHNYDGSKRNFSEDTFYFISWQIFFFYFSYVDVVAYAL